MIDIGSKDQCFIPFVINSVDQFVLGEPFFRNFYTIFDDSKGVVGLTPSIKSPLSTIVEGIVPNNELPGLSKPQDQQ